MKGYHHNNFQQVHHHYPNQCWLIISGVLWHSHEGNFTANSQNIYPWYESENDLFNTLRPRQNGDHFADDIFKCIFFNENEWILTKISLKFVLKGQINNIPVLVQIMAWRQPGNKSLSEPMMVRLLMHIYVTRPQWVKIVTAISPRGQWIDDVFFTRVIWWDTYSFSTACKVLWNRNTSIPTSMFLTND